jgi:hypothetical protein
MPLPSFHRSENKRAWSIPRAAGYGAVLGALAGLFRILAPFDRLGGAGPAAGVDRMANAAEIVAATLGFALLCAGAAALRNFIARRLMGPGVH